MEIIVGKYSGFCNGVKYTVDKANEILENNKSIYSLGDIVHNEIVINSLKEKGLIVKDNIESIPNNSKVIIRAHGEKLDTYKKAKEKNLEVLDLTCGKVKSIHNKILSKKDEFFIIIIGKNNHPETIAHKTYSDNSFIVENKSDVINAYNSFLNSNLEKVYIVAQTTFNQDLFDEIVNEIEYIFPVEILVDKTICNATNLRQEEVKEIASKVDKMIIIGGKNSSNTKELENIAKLYCRDVYLIQSLKDLNEDNFNNDDIIGISAGASTPKEVIISVVNSLNSLHKIKKK